MKTVKQRWLNLILHLSSDIYSKKEMMKSFSLFGKLAFWVQIVFYEILLSVVSLPFYFFISPDKVFQGNKDEIRIYRLRRKITFTAIGIFLGWHFIQIAALFGGIVSSPRTSSAATTVPLVVSGTYTGLSTGPANNDDRVISGLGFQPDVVMIKSTTTDQTVIRTSTMPAGDNSKQMVSPSTGFEANLIQSFTSDGFTIGTDGRVNRSGSTYYWTAFKAYAGSMSLGTYSGSGSSQAITGTGFQPDFVMMIPHNANSTAFRTSAMLNNKSYYLDSGDSGFTSGLTSFDTNGFHVSGYQVNSSGTTYHYIAWKAAAGRMVVGSYVGNGANPRSISGLGLNPELMMIRADTYANAVFRPAALTGDNTLTFNNSAVGSGKIKSLQIDPTNNNDFQVGSDGSVNSNSVAYYYVGWLRSAKPTFTQSAYRFFGNRDSTDVDTALAANSTSASLTSAGQAFRLRTLIKLGGDQLIQNGETFKLQYAGKGTGTCASPGGTPASYTDVNTTSTLIAFKNNATPTDGSNLTANASDPTNGADTIVSQTYEEANNFTNSTAAIPSGQDGKWDFALFDNGAPLNTTYCFRVVVSDGTALDTYTTYPEIPIVIYSAPPTVTNVTSSTADGSYTTSDSVSIQVVFSEAVTVTGTPQLTLETGTSDAVVDYASGSGTDTLTFTYTVASGQNSSDLDYTSTSALAFNSGTIKDAANNDATLTLATPGQSGSLAANKAIVIDTALPSVSNVTSSTTNGSYTTNGVISIQVVFNKTVIVTGTPQLTLETGVSDAVVNYASGSGTNTLTFNYTVASGHISSDLDYASTSALALNSGTIKDAANNVATLTLATPGQSGSLGANKAIVIDTTALSVSDVTSSTTNGSYKTNDVVSIQVVFNKVVRITGIPQLTLETGLSDAVVDYDSGSGTDTLTFTYTVASGQNSSDLDYVSSSALALNSGTIQDTAGNDATLTLATPGQPNSLGANKAIVIDTASPTVINVTSSTTNGSYSTSDPVSIQVVFSEAVTVTGTPQLTLETGTSDAVADYASGSGTDTLTFSYTVASGQNSSDLDYVSTSALALNSGTIKDAIGNDATLTLATPGQSSSLGANKAIVIDTTAPSVSSVTSSTANGSYTAGGVISIQVVFSENVTVTGTPQLTLETGTSDAAVNYASGSGTDTLTFNYTVSSGHSASDLDYTSTSALALNGGTIKDALNLNANLTLPSPGTGSSLGGSKAIVIDTTAPAVTSVTSSTPNGTYTTGQTISIQLAFDKDVDVTGAPHLTLETGSTDGVAVYDSGSGSSALTFVYTISYGENSSSLDYLASNPLSLNGGSIKDSLGNDAALNLPAAGGAGSLSANTNFVVDTTVATVTSVTSSTTNGTYTTSELISIQLVFDKVVNVTGTPHLTLETGVTDAVVNYSSGSGSNTLTFNYTVGSGQNSSDLDYVSNAALSLNSGTIKDTLNNNANLTLPNPGADGSLGNSKNIRVDTSGPVVTGVNSSTANGSYTTSDAISIQVGFDEIVTVTGTPQLTLETGSSDAVVNYAGGSGSDTLTFTYTVASGQNSADLDYVSINALSLNGGTIRDAIGNNAALTLAAPGAAGSLAANKAIVVDTAVPSVSSVTSSTADGSYKTADQISIQVVFSKIVNVTGTPQLTLETGASNTSGSYSGGSGTTSLTFTYTVVAGDFSNDLDYISTSALSLGGGTIKDAAENDAILTLPAPGASGSLGANKNIQVDTVAPGQINLQFTQVSTSSVQLRWQATGDDVDVGTATSYDIRYSRSLITADNFSAATAVSGVPVPAVANTTQNVTVSGLTANQNYYFATRVTDDMGNVSTVYESAPVMLTGSENNNTPIVGASASRPVLPSNYQPPVSPAPGPVVKNPQTTQTSGIKSFSDIARSPYKDSIEKLSSKCPISGYGPDSAGRFNFKPFATITRAEVVTLLIKCRFAGPFSLPLKQLFLDLKVQDWPSPYVFKAISLGMVDAQKKLFRPNDQVSFSEALKLTLMARFSLDEINKTKARSVCMDVPLFAWYAKYYTFAIDHGVYAPKLTAKGNVCNPEANISRGEVAKLAVLTFF